MKLLLAIDIGNTNITIGLFRKNKLLYTLRLVTLSEEKAGRYNRQLKNILLKYRIKEEEIEGIIICSVAPEALKNLKTALKSIFKLKPLILGENIDSGIKNLYTNPKQVGQDRLVNARAAYEIYKKGCIIVDFGTAVTIDAVNKRKEYLGGLITPGLEISLEALSEKTALLPKLKLAKAKNLIGKNTRDSILSGIFYGFGSLCDGVIDKFKSKLGGDLLAVATGGHSPVIAPYCKNIDIVNPNLTLQGLRIIYDDYIKKPGTLSPL